MDNKERRTRDKVFIIGDVLAGYLVAGGNIVPNYCCFPGSQLFNYPTLKDRNWKTQVENTRDLVA